MAGVLQHNSYGKEHIRLTKLVRHSDRHELMELSAGIHLEGDFAASYETGDNSKIIATDSMKNTVYVLARENNFDSIEAFAVILAKHFKSTYPQVTIATVSIEQALWQRTGVYSFVGGLNEKRTCRAKLGDRLELSGGIRGLSVLKTTGSEFSDFVTDRFRALKNTRDRILATTVEADWQYSDQADYNGAYAAVRAAMIATFAAHHSLAVQQTLLEMGKAALDACREVKSIRLAMPNQHRIPFNLEPFGLKNANDIFVPVDEPFGLITGVVERE